MSNSHQVHFNAFSAFEDIYTAGKHPKEANFYDAFGNTEASFGFIDPQQAKARKDILRPLFSRRAILKLEDVVQGNVCRLITLPTIVDLIMTDL